ncbi:hydrophobin 2 [Podospora fimiseda]|uniref:Hydrophobin 2 n=1 Tax=Podospora fimiseda TaxID=252190 RepID=A0AAN6YMN2_9PEZI|nr:hydrophobin 2 [Podospora fimiseda]
MKLTTTATVFLAAALQSGVCLARVCPSDVYSNPQCCGLNVAGVLGVDCETPVSVIDGDAFAESCELHEKGAACCAIPVLGQGILCTPAILD